MNETTTSIQLGERVRVKSYGIVGGEKYNGLEGLLVAHLQRSQGLIHLVLLDNDPEPGFAAMMGGLPCFANELEVIE